MQENNTTRLAAYTGLAGLFILCIASLWYYKERMLFTDASFILFNIITEGRLYIQENRFGAFITQMVPMLGSKMHLPLKTILLSYSLSFNLFYFLSSAVLVFVCRQYKIAVLLCFYYLLFASEAFYWSNNEIFQATAWMMLGFGTLLYRTATPRHLLRICLFAALITTAIFTHAGVIPIVFFLSVYYLFISNNYPQQKSKLLVTLIIAAVITIKLILSSSQTYDSGKMHNALHFSLHDIVTALGSDFSIYFIKQCITNYWVAVILFVWGMSYLLIHKKYKLAALCGFTAIAYYVLICLVFNNLTGHHLYYIESEIMGMAIICTLPFVYYILPALKPRVVFILMLLIIGSRLLYIYNGAKRFTARVDITTTILNQMDKDGINKLAIIDGEDVKKTMIEPWAAGAESIILSAMNGQSNRSFYFVKDSSAVPTDRYIYAGCFHDYKPDQMNNQYFTIDTNSHYIIRYFKNITP
ncbi:hypothetical protein CAP35_04065 [Chitinophagaceae bacterium IBVUCB1]|nr:hypothetical protein CAP35_04065 [Chitinophagaceae bacterium IBVUCB1]